MFNLNFFKNKTYYFNVQALIWEYFFTVMAFILPPPEKLEKYMFFSEIKHNISLPWCEEEEEDAELEGTGAPLLDPNHTQH